MVNHVQLFDLVPPNDGGGQPTPLRATYPPPPPEKIRPYDPGLLIIDFP